MQLALQVADELGYPVGLVRRLVNKYGSEVAEWSGKRLRQHIESEASKGYTTLDRKGLQLETQFPRQQQAMSSARSDATMGGVGGENVQYTAAIRNTRSKYGKRRRKNLKNAWYELNKDKIRVLSRYQAFQTGGFAAALGPYSCVHTTPETGKQNMPMWVFRLSSYPQATTVRSDGNTITEGSPVVAYRLQRSLNGTTNATYTWEPISFSYHPNSGNNNYNNTYDIYHVNGPSTGEVRDKRLHGFRHEWSNIKMTFYPQTQLPTDWTVRLVKFKEDLTDWPKSEVRNQTGAKLVVYELTGDTSPEAAAVTTMYDSYFGGKLIHPHNTQTVTETPYGKLPFVPLRTEKFYVPAREQTVDEAPTRVLHKHFFKNDRHYNSGINYLTRNINLATVGTFNYIDENINNQDVVLSSPLTKPGDEVWLMVEATGYKTAPDNTHEEAPVATYPTFDICIRNCHSHRDGDKEGRIAQYPSSGAPTSAIEPSKQELLTETTEV